MDHDREIGFLGGGIELVHARIAQRHAIDMRADFDPAKPERADAGETARRKGRILDRSHADPDKMLRMGRAQFRDGAVDMIGQRVGIIGGKPVRQQFGHRREDLNVDVIGLHVFKTAAGIPASGIDQAEYLAADHHRGTVPAAVFDRRPERIAPCGGRHCLGNKVGMHVDRPGHRFLPCDALR